MGEKNWFSYFPQETLERFDDEEMMRLVTNYEPENELVLVLLKPNYQTSSYQVRPQPPQ